MVFKPLSPEYYSRLYFHLQYRNILSSFGLCNDGRRNFTQQERLYIVSWWLYAIEMMKGEGIRCLLISTLPIPFRLPYCIYAQRLCEAHWNEREICRLMAELHVCTLTPSVSQMSRLWVEKSLFKHLTIQYATTFQPFTTTFTASVQQCICMI